MKSIIFGALMKTKKKVNDPYSLENSVELFLLAIHLNLRCSCWGQNSRGMTSLS